MTFNQHWARQVSILFNPLLMPLLAFVLLFSLQAYFSLLIPIRAKLTILSVVFINTALLPFFSIIVLRKMGLVDSYELHHKEERLYPLMLGTILLYLTYFLFNRLSFPAVYSTFLFGAALVALLALIISWKFKISIHMTAAGGVTGMLLALQIKAYAPIVEWIALALFFSGMIATARLILKAHTPAQVYTGFLLGAGVILTVYLLT